VNEAYAELAKDQPDHDVLAVKSRKLEEVLKEVAEWDQKISEGLVDTVASEADLEAEDVSVEEYREKAYLAQNKINALLYPTLLPPRASSPTPSVHSSNWYNSVASSTTKRTIKLPTIELKKFNGDLSEWLGWWSQFSKIHDDGTLHPVDKFHYLIQSMVVGSRASDLVKSYPVTDDNYSKVIDALTQRFGKPKVLKQVYVRELLKIVIDNAKSKEKLPLSKLFDKLESHLRALESLKVSSEQMSEFLYPMVESSIPAEIFIAWQRSPKYGCDGSHENPPKSELYYLLDFLRKEVENEDQREMVQTGFAQQSSSKDKRDKNWSENLRKRKEDIPTAATLLATREDKRSVGCECAFCGGKSHLSQDCL
jgi:hypothetical protein